MGTLSAILLATLVWQVIDFIKELANLPTSKDAVVTQVSAWAGGVLLAFVAGHAKVTANVALPGMPTTFGHLDVASLVIVGLLLSSFASSLVDTTGALNSGYAVRRYRILPSSSLAERRASQETIGELVARHEGTAGTTDLAARLADSTGTGTWLTSPAARGPEEGITDRLAANTDRADVQPKTEEDPPAKSPVAKKAPAKKAATPRASRTR